ncbi:MAG: GIY-YIG nuclease family protein [Chroococcidiopsis sp.]
MIEETCGNIEIDPDTFPWVRLEDRAQLPEIRACYFVTVGEDVLYIGKTDNLNRRWRGHHLLKVFQEFNEVRISWLAPLPGWKLDEFEKELINAYQPKINRPFKPENTKRLTIDISPELHYAIKTTAIAQGILMADMLRELLESKYTSNT